MTIMRVNSSDLLAAAIFALFGAYFCAAAITQLQIGTALSMGPGYFPVVLGILLLLFGGAIALGAIGKPKQTLARIPWRAAGFLSLAPILFALTVRGLGLGPATALCVLSATLASRRNKPGFAAALTIGLTIFSVLVFRVGLGLPLPLLGHWLSP
jgi:hypothetical protein